MEKMPSCQGLPQAGSPWLFGSRPSGYTGRYWLFGSRASGFTQKFRPGRAVLL